MDCHLYTILLCWLTMVTIIYARNDIIMSSGHCPCTLNVSTLAADCSDKHLQKIPASDCVPATTRLLDLSINDITYQPGQFQRFTALTRLDMSGNNYFIPGNDSFSGLDQLQVLDLSWTDLRNFQDSLFTEPTNLETLSLFKTGLHFLPAKLFDNLQHLKSLDLGWTFKTNTSNSPFTALPHLQYLSLRFNDNIALTKQSFTGLTDLVRLDLTGCGLTNLTLDVFVELVNLSELDLSHNKLREIQDNQFSSLQRLLHLNLSLNREINLHSHSFAGLSELKYLALRRIWISQVTSFPNDVFEPLRNIEELHLEGFARRLEDYRYHQENISENLSKLSSLKKLYLDNFAISFLGVGFSSLVNLEELSFEGYGSYRIGTFSNETFKNFRNSPVSTLVMNKYETELILPYTFSTFGNLTSLDLTHLELSYWCNYGLRNVETGLQDTNITRLRLQLRCQGRGKSISGLRSLEGTTLETLDLSDGSITGIRSDFFRYLPVSLKYLYLHNNDISYIHFYDLYRLANLVFLDLSHQIHVCQLPANDTVGNIKQDVEKCPDVPNVSNVIDIAETKKDISAVRNSSQNINQDCYKLPPSLETMDISKSKLFCVIKEVLCDPDNSLKTLIMADQNDLQCFSAIWGLLNNLKKLEHLNLNGNSIKTIPSDSFVQLRFLRKLHLKHNFLAIVEFHIQRFVLQILDISHNNVLYISTTLTEKLDEIADRTGLIVYLNNNSLLCNCERIEFVAWLRFSSAIYQKEKLTCHESTNKKYSLSEISKLHESLRYKCTVKEVTLGCIALFVLLHLILGIGYLIWYKRWKFRYLLAVGRKNVYPYHPIEDCEIELEYDVYISYERDYDVSRDRTLHELVAQVVYPALQRRGFRVVIREEIEPGAGLYNSISYYLRRSKKVVALISRDYCRDYWNVFEFNMAVLEGIYTKRQVLIPVAFEQIGRDDLHDEIYAFLRAGSVGHHTANVTDEMLVDYLCDKIRDNREFGE